MQANKPPEEQLKKEIDRVRSDGLAVAIEDGQVPGLLSMAELMPGASPEAKVEELLLRAIAATPARYTDLMPYAALWLGLHPDTRGKPSVRRWEAAWEAYRADDNRTREKKSFRTNKPEQLRRELARTLRRANLTAAPTAQDQQPSSVAPAVVTEADAREPEASVASPPGGGVAAPDDGGSPDADLDPVASEAGKRAPDDDVTSAPDHIEAVGTETQTGWWPPPRRRVLQAIVGGVIAACIVAAVIVGAGLVSDGQGAESPSLTTLSGQADRALARAETPEPGEISDTLGFGDSAGSRETIPYVWDAASQKTPTINSMIDTSHPVGNGHDERRFLSVDVVSPSPINLQSAFRDRVEVGGTRRVTRLRFGHVARVSVYVANNAADQPDCGSLTGATVAHEVVLRIRIWTSSDGSLHIVRAWVSGENTEPRWVTDAIAILTGDGVRLRPDAWLSSKSRDVPRLLELNQPVAAFAPGGDRVGEFISPHDARLGACERNRVSYQFGLRQTQP